MSEENKENMHTEKEVSASTDTKQTIRKNTAKKATSSTKQTPKPKNLTMAQVKRKAKDVNKMEEYELDTEGQIKVKFYPVFPESKVNELLEEMQGILAYVIDEQGIEFTEKNLTDHIFFLCIKHFTHLGKDISDKFEEQLVQMEHLIDTGYYAQIINEVFAQSEMNKIAKAIADMQSKFEFLMSIDKTAEENLEQLELKNKEMFNTLDTEVIRKKVENRHR